MNQILSIGIYSWHFIGGSHLGTIFLLSLHVGALLKHLEFRIWKPFIFSIRLCTWIACTIFFKKARHSIIFNSHRKQLRAQFLIDVANKVVYTHSAKRYLCATNRLNRPQRPIQPMMKNRDGINVTTEALPTWCTAISLIEGKSCTYLVWPEPSRAEPDTGSVPCLCATRDCFFDEYETVALLSSRKKQ